eukprot:GHVR01155893.1.p1 GENE.GHVR01155893.1~~GHVR01155893.1.p1  ORF type:complete len:368 (+),score=115.38 GHVR01155893.1:111-1106(+)
MDESARKAVLNTRYFDGQNTLNLGQNNNNIVDISNEIDNLTRDSEGEEYQCILERVSEINEGGEFGEWGLATEEKRSASVVTMAQSIVFVLERQHYRIEMKSLREKDVLMQAGIELLRTRCKERRQVSEVTTLDLLLSRNSYLNSLEREFRHVLCGHMFLRYVEQGHTIYTQGDTADSFMCLLKGTANVYKVGGLFYEFEKKKKWKDTVMRVAIRYKRKKLLEIENDDWVCMLVDLADGTRTIPIHPYLIGSVLPYTLYGCVSDSPSPSMRSHTENSLFSFEQKDKKNEKNILNFLRNEAMLLKGLTPTYIHTHTHTNTHTHRKFKDRHTQ